MRHGTGSWLELGKNQEQGTAEMGKGSAKPSLGSLPLVCRCAAAALTGRKLTWVWAAASMGSTISPGHHCCATEPWFSSQLGLFIHFFN